MEKQRESRKRWPPYKYWTEYLKQEGSIWLGEYQTINHALAAFLLKRDGKEHGEKELNRFAEYLDSGRNMAIKILWSAGKERYVLGSGKIEAITNDPADKEEHLRRLGRMRDVKTIATAQKSIGATEKQCLEFGLPGFKEINKAQQRLLIGDSDFIVHLKRLE